MDAVAQRISDCFDQEFDANKIKDLYKKWSVEYDDDMTAVNLVSCQTASSKIAKYIQSPSTTAVVDVGCGSGRCAQHLQNNGFEIVDGVDISLDMLAKAEATKLYRTLYAEVDVSKPMDLNGNLYDAAVATGLYVDGHVKPDSIMNVLGCMNVGGIFVFSAREDYKAGQNLDDYVKKIAAEGVVEILEAAYDQPYNDLSNATYYTLKKL